MKENFEALKKELLTKAKVKGAYSKQYLHACHATNESDLLSVIKDNITWCHENCVIDMEYFSKFTPEIFAVSGIKNIGTDNTGWCNSGDSNSGDSNSGDSNSGDSNSGWCNSGYSNSGYSNSGDRNSGDSNSGDRNSGSWNSGDRNSGYSNSGSWNSGDRNSGYSNSGDNLSGVFCTGKRTIEMFNKPSNWTIKDFQNSAAFEILSQYVDTKMWIDENVMTDAEKQQNPKFKTTGGYLKDIPLKEAFTNAWHNLNSKKRAAFTSLPNFDASIFEQITGVNVNAS